MAHEEWGHNVLASVRLPAPLELVKSDIRTSACERFVVNDHFKKGVAGICSVNSTFQHWFGNKVEENVPAATLTSSLFRSGSCDHAIRAELGKNYEVFLCWVFEKLNAQADGCQGELLIDGRPNIFYVDGGGIVDMAWCVSGGWDVVTPDFTFPPLVWGFDGLVFSRNLV
jgi:hypothetical protein